VLVGNHGEAPVLLKNNAWVEIKWPPPSGRVERLTDVPIDRYVTIVEGKGRVEG
jgi:hypothetical protein